MDNGSSKPMRKYEVEVWWRNRTKVGEIGRLLNSFKWAESRNGVGSIDFNIDQGVLSDYCQKIGEDPAVLLQLKNTDIKLKRYGKYRIGGFVNDFPDINFNQSNTTVSVSCDGYLNLLADQLITDTRRYTQQYTADIASDLIRYACAKSGSTLDITISNANYYATQVRRDRTYDNKQNIKDAVVNLTSLGDGSNDFDFRFTPFREWESYDINNPIVHDMTVIYPAPAKASSRQAGATSMSMKLVSSMANYIIARGSGQGDTTLVVTASDAESIAQYGIHESVLDYSDISVRETLLQHAEAELAVKKLPIFLPQPKVNGAEFDVGSIRAGEVIRVINNKSPWFKVDGLYRIEEMVVSVNSEGSEEVDLTLSSLGVKQ